MGGSSYYNSVLIYTTCVHEYSQKVNVMIISYTNDFKRKLKEKRPELTNKVPSELESFRRLKGTFLIGNVVRMV